MSSLTEKVRETVRGRSRSRKAAAKDDGKTSNDFQPSGRADVRGPENSVQARTSSPTIPAWHIHKGNVRTSHEAPPPIPSLDTLSALDRDGPTGTHHNTAAQRVDEYTLPPQRDDRAFVSDSDRLTAPSHALRQVESGDSDKIPVRSLSTYDPATDTIIKQSAAAQGDRPEVPPQPPVGYPYTVPRRKESLPQNRAHRKNKSSLGKGAGQQANVGMPREATAPIVHTEPNTSLPHQSMGGDLGNEINEALASLDVSDRPTEPVAASSSRDGQLPVQNEHLRLPEGFSLGHTESTTIDTRWEPAVTHENIHRQRTEVVQEAITRDIHIHHYYTYVQPIKIVEVLPAKHYRVDPSTGRKVEIAAPPGWQMPAHLEPHTEDTSNVKAYTRHYLVNDQYPYGISEPPPPENFNVGGGRSRANKYSTRPY